MGSRVDFPRLVAVVWKCAIGYITFIGEMQLSKDRGNWSWWPRRVSSKEFTVSSRFRYARSAILLRNDETTSFVTRFTLYLVTDSRRIGPIYVDLIMGRVKITAWNRLFNRGRD
jgi:hypothetical protein